MTELEWIKEDVDATVEYIQEMGVEATAGYLYELAEENGVDVSAWRYDLMLAELQGLVIR